MTSPVCGRHDELMLLGKTGYYCASCQYETEKAFTRRTAEIAQNNNVAYLALTIMVLAALVSLVIVTITDAAYARFLFGLAAFICGAGTMTILDDITSGPLANLRDKI